MLFNDILNNRRIFLLTCQSYQCFTQSTARDYGRKGFGTS